MSTAALNVAQERIGLQLQLLELQLARLERRARTDRHEVLRFIDGVDRLVGHVEGLDDLARTTLERTEAALVAVADLTPTRPALLPSVEAAVRFVPLTDAAGFARAGNDSVRGPAPRVAGRR